MTSSPQGITRPAAAPSLKYIAAYPLALQEQVRELLARGALGKMLRTRYPQSHEVRTDKALFDYTAEMKARFMRNAEPLSRVQYDNKLKVLQHALGTHTAVSRVQGGKLKAKREIRIASLFKDAPAEFLKMIVVHELAHIKEREHDKAFYALCTHMAPDYHQLEFDLRLYLTQQDMERAAARELQDAPAGETESALLKSDPAPSSGCT